MNDIFKPNRKVTIEKYDLNKATSLIRYAKDLNRRIQEYDISYSSQNNHIRMNLHSK